MASKPESILDFPPKTQDPPPSCHRCSGYRVLLEFSHCTVVFAFHSTVFPQRFHCIASNHFSLRGESYNGFPISRVSPFSVPSLSSARSSPESLVVPVSGVRHLGGPEFHDGDDPHGNKEVLRFDRDNGGRFETSGYTRIRQSAIRSRNPLYACVLPRVSSYIFLPNNFESGFIIPSPELTTEDDAQDIFRALV